MLHNDAIHLLGRCPCPCGIAAHSPAAQAACWCNPRRRASVPAATPVEDTAAVRAHVEALGGWWTLPSIAHNDAVRHLRSCGCRCHTDRGASCTCSGPTDPRLTAAFDTAERRDLHRRLTTGRATPAEYARHAPHIFSRR